VAVGFNCADTADIRFALFILMISTTREVRFIGKDEGVCTIKEFKHHQISAKSLNNDI